MKQTKKTRKRNPFLVSTWASLFKTFVFGVCLVFGVWNLVIAAVTAATAAPEWKVLKGQHFLVHYTGSSDFAEKIADKAEEYYGKITADLGFAKHDNYWLWDDRVKIFIYPSKNNFAAATGAPDWAVGKAVGAKREISTFAGDESFGDSVLPHEMTHLVFREFLGLKDSNVPLWLNEGVAQWEEATRRSQRVRLAVSLVRGGAAITFRKFMQMDVRAVVESGKAGEFYAQAVSLVGFIIETRGSDAFRRFCSELRDGRTVDDALKFAYPDALRNIDSLEQAWKTYVLEQQEAGR